MFYPPKLLLEGTSRILFLTCTVAGLTLQYEVSKISQVHPNDQSLNALLAKITQAEDGNGHTLKKRNPSLYFKLLLFQLGNIYNQYCQMFVLKRLSVFENAELLH